MTSIWQIAEKLESRVRTERNFEEEGVFTSKVAGIEVPVWDEKAKSVGNLR